MDVKIKKSALSLIQGDITLQETDAVVNAANTRLAGGRASTAPFTRPEDLPSWRNADSIHTVGPVYQGGMSGEAALLKSAYLESLKLASARGLKSLAFPAISTGVYAYPVNEAARIALTTVMDYLGEHSDLELVRFVLFSRKMYDVFAGELKKLIHQPGH
jgi:O-acetyl-ADP-ribose deacetylase (regulator of RNase III)